MVGNTEIENGFTVNVGFDKKEEPACDPNKKYNVTLYFKDKAGINSYIGIPFLMFCFY